MSGPDLPIGSPIPLGRTKEAGEIEAVLDSVAQGHKRGVHLIGSPGVGKTTLLHWAHDQARHAGFLCSFVRAPLTGGLPPRFPLPEIFEGLSQAHRDTGQTIPAALEETTSALRAAGSRGHKRSTPPDLLHIVAALRGAAASDRVGIFIDDVQWVPADATQALIAALRVVDEPILFASAARPGESDGAASAPPESSADLPIQYLELHGLDLDAVAEVAAETLGGPVLPSLVRELHRKTLGNPLFVLETLRQWLTEEAVRQVAGGYWAISAAVSDDISSLTGVIGHRLRRLRGGSLDAARTLAVLGRRVSFEEMRSLMDPTSTREGLVDHLAALEAAGIVRGEAGSTPGYTMAHPLFGAALLSDMGPTRRGALHARIYEVLVDRKRSGVTVPASEIAHHAELSLELPSEAHAYFAAAARDAEQVGSYGEAATWFGVLATTARTPEFLLDAFRGKAAATQHFDPEAAIPLYEEALIHAATDRDRAQLLLGRARARRMAASDLDAALEDLRHALEIGGPEIEFETRHLIGILHGIRGEIDAAEQVFNALSARSRGTAEHAKVVGALGHVAYVRGSLRSALELTRTALAEAKEADHRKHVNMSLAWFSTLSGDWEQAERVLQPALVRARRDHDLWILMPMLCTGTRLAAWKGDLTAAFDLGTEVMRLSAQGMHSHWDRIHSINALSVALIEAEKPGDALAIQADLPSLVSQSSDKWDNAYPLIVLAETHLLLGDLDRARAVAEHARTFSHLNRAFSCHEDRLDAAIALAEDDLARAIAIVERRAESVTETPFELARVHEVGAAAYARSGQPDRALQSAEKALDLYEQLGARIRSARVREWISGHRGRKAGRPRSDRPAGLTDREIEILQRVIQGETNRAIAESLTLSPATVKKHVENILAKTGAARRSELARRITELGIQL